MESHFEKAANADCMRPCMQNRVDTAGMASHKDQAGNKKAPDLQGLTASFEGIQNINNKYFCLHHEGKAQTTDYTPSLRRLALRAFELAGREP